MDKVRAFLTRQVGPFPVYAYVGGGIVLIAALLYFRGKANTGPATPAPQTNYSPSDVPLPYPDAGSGASGIPPSAPFDTSGQGIVQGDGQYVIPQSNFVPPQSQPTPSQSYATSVALPVYGGGRFGTTVGSSTTSIPASAGSSIQSNIGSILSSIRNIFPTSAPAPAATTAYGASTGRMGGVLQ